MAWPIPAVAEKTGLLFYVQYRTLGWGFSPPARLLPPSDSWRSLFIPGGTVELNRASHEALTRDATVFRRDLMTRGYVVTSDARTEQVYAAVRDDISRRLSTVCSDWPEAEFARLVDDVTRTAINHSRVEELYPKP